MDKLKSYTLSIMKDERNTLDAYIVKALLSIASLIYLALLKCIYFLYKAKILCSYEMPAKVISIGNITLGGTGKTPFAVKLAEDIKAMGKRPVVLNRGYGNDESYLLKEKLKDTPVLIGKDRVKNAIRAFNEFGSDCIILDDGFQHYRIKRDFNIILIDATFPFGNMKLFPRGILREPLARLKDADFVILTKSDMGRDNTLFIRELLKKINKKIEIAESFYQPIDLSRVFTPRDVSKTLPGKTKSLTGFTDEKGELSYIAGKKIALLAGIANPSYFDWIIGNLGAEIVERFFYPDHYLYKNSDMEYIAEKCLGKGVDTILTTEKDTVRLKRLKDIPAQIEIFALRIDFRLSSNEKAIIDRLHSIFNR